MSILERGLRCIIRKPKKNILLLLLLYLISTLLILTIGIFQNQMVTFRDLQSELEGVLRITLDVEDSRRRTELYQDKYMIEGEGFTIFVAPDCFYTIISEDIQAIISVDGINYYNVVSQPLVLTPINFESIRPEGAVRAPDLVNVTGASSTKWLDEIVYEFIVLREGVWAEDSTVDTPLIISENLAEYNGLTIGDELIFKWEDAELEVVLEVQGRERENPIYKVGIIVGIFSIERPIFAFQGWSRMENTIFSNLEFRENMLRDVEHHSYLYTLVTLTIDDMAQYDTLKEAVLAVDIDWNRYMVVDGNAVYQSLTRRFDSLSRVIYILFIITVCFGFLLLAFLLSLFVRQRIHEIATFLSVGISKVEILFQFAFEVTIVLLIAFMLSSITASPLSTLVEWRELSARFEPPVVLPEGVYVSLPDGGILGYGFMMDALGRDYYSVLLTSNPVTVRTLGLVLVVLIIISLVSISLSLAPIIRLKPKEILTKLK